MDIYSQFIRKTVLNYIVGSFIAVMFTGLFFIFVAIKMPVKEALFLMTVLMLSLVIMISVELAVFFRHLHPIRRIYREGSIPSYEELRKAYIQTHRLPLLAIKRIVLPHMMGLMIPGILLTYLSIYMKWIHVPYSYLVLAIVCAPVVAGMHAFIEFFLTSHAIIPVVNHIRSMAYNLYGKDLSLEGSVLISVRKKFLYSAFLIGTFPLFLFSIAGYIRQDYLDQYNFMSYWEWTTIFLVAGAIFSSFGAWVLSRDIQHPIRNITASMRIVQQGKLDHLTPDIYSDEFSQLVAGFNHMVRALKNREDMTKLLIQSYFTTLATVLDARDPYTAGHSKRVAHYSHEIGKLAGLTDQELDTLRKAALLHDIGKIGIRDTVLLKEGKLTDEEFEIIKQHTVLGEKILLQIEPADAMVEILPGVRSHHERYDGNGYPDRLAGNSIPVMGRIIAIADAYDAMTSNRTYRQGMTEEKALSIMLEGKGTQWDPYFTGLFIANFERIRLEHEDKGSSPASKHATM
ncbi:HD domain-containing phosphohydrolase [Paenibacillus massiliensis]|uniref:HD domain-containing phosphohydrolase n=2 Tax=Paenibacillus massiliensis TaxID=225917 RepID=UPI00037AE6CD|nr:HD domain-containing phosphohydrolase [Paenibacillus massiliensis]